jgi:hypothetical protein
MSVTIDKIRLMMFATYNYLPIVLMTTMITFGVGLGNMGMLSIFAGQLTLMVVVWFLRSLLFFQGAKSEFYAFVPTQRSHQYPSMWITQVTFFLSCILANAATLYQKDDTPNSGSDPAIASKIYNRKSRCVMVIVMAAIFLLGMVGYRLYAEHVGSDGVVGMFGSLVALALGGAGATLWWWASAQPNIGIQNMDVFGISQQLVQVRQTDVKTMCELVANQ